MQRISDYLEHATQFEQLASEATDPKLKASLLGQAQSYRELARRRTRRLNVPLSPRPDNPN